MPARWLLSAVLAIATALGVEPQIVRDTRPPLHSGVDLVMVTITVLDGSGRLITGLDQDEFTVFEDGERQPISVFINTRVPVGLGVLLDVSDSMFGQRILDARAAVERFLFTLLAPEDQVLSGRLQPCAATPHAVDSGPGRRARGAGRHPAVGRYRDLRRGAERDAADAEAFTGAGCAADHL